MDKEHLKKRTVKMRPKNFKIWLATVRKLLKNPDTSDKNNNLYSLSFDVRRFPKSLRYNIGNIQELLDVMRLLRDAKGSGRGVFEDHIMKELNYLMFDCAEMLESSGAAHLKCWDVPENLSDELKVKCNIVVILCKFAIESIEFSRPRDSLAGKRRTHSFDMLGHASYLYSMPENIITRLLKELKSKRGTAAMGTLLFLESYYKARKISVPADVEKLLIDFAEKTDSRSKAVGALNILVEAGNISEFVALDYIDDWKERNYYT